MITSCNQGLSYPWNAALFFKVLLQWSYYTLSTNRDFTLSCRIFCLMVASFVLISRKVFICVISVNLLFTLTPYVNTLNNYWHCEGIINIKTLNLLWPLFKNLTFETVDQFKKSWNFKLYNKFFILRMHWPSFTDYLW